MALHVGVPRPLDFQDQRLITLGTATAQCRVALLRRVTVVTGRGDLQDTTNRLDLEMVTLLIDRGPQDLVRRPNSAWAKQALARRRISLALPLAILSLQGLDGIALFGGRPRALAGIGLVATNPTMQGLCCTANLRGAGLDGRSCGGGVAQVLQNHAHGTFTDFRA